MKPSKWHIVIGVLAFAAGALYIGMAAVADMLTDD
jgi:hypothetical protein